MDLRSLVAQDVEPVIGSWRDGYSVVLADGVKLAVDAYLKCAFHYDYEFVDGVGVQGSAGAGYCGANVEGAEMRPSSRPTMSHLR